MFYFFNRGHCNDWFLNVKLSLLSQDNSTWLWCTIHFCSVTQSYMTLLAHGLQHTSFPCLSPAPGACSNSHPLDQWCHPTITVAPFSSWPQSFPASGSFPMNWLFISGGQSSGASAFSSVLPMNVQGWFSLGLTGLISLLYKGLSKVFSSTII